MIDLQIPGETVRILQIGRRRVAIKPWPIYHSQTIRRKGRDLLARILTERADVQGYLVVEQSHTAAHNRAVRCSWQEHDSHSRREVIVGLELIAIETKAGIQSNAAV